MIRAVVFDLDNTLLDFMNMKSKAIESALRGMIEAGLDIDKVASTKKIFSIVK